MMRHLATTEGNSLELRSDMIGAPGTQRDLIIKPMFHTPRSDEAIRLSNREPRQFEVKARLARGPQTSTSFDGTFDRNSGSSYLTVAPKTDHLILDLPEGQARLDVNGAREVSMVSATVTARSGEEARYVFGAMLTEYLDRMSYLTRAPVHVTQIVARDVEHEVQFIHVVSPPVPAQISSGGEQLEVEMKAIYALYREAMNSSSPYYRVLCLYKIMEGLLGSLRRSLFARAKAISIDVRGEKELVPDHEDLAAHLKEHAGKPLKPFFDGYLTTEYRNALAHYELKEGSVLDVSSPIGVARFTDIAFLSDLCTRALIGRHEERVVHVRAAETAAAAARATD